MSFPLGKPLNRPEPPKRFPVEGRPNWWHDGKGGSPYYVEPPPKTPDVVVIPTAEVYEWFLEGHVVVVAADPDFPRELWSGM